MIELGELNTLISTLVGEILDGSSKDANEKMRISANMDRSLKKLTTAIIERAVKEAQHALARK